MLIPPVTLRYDPAITNHQSPIRDPAGKTLRFCHIPIHEQKRKRSNTMSNSTILITGANRGIGLELAKQYAVRGAEIIGVCRESADELDTIAARTITGIHLDKAADLQRLADELADTKIDILINNAGMWHDESIDDMNVDFLAEQMAINAYAPLKITSLLLPNLSQGSKVAMITSRMGSIADNTSGGRYGYRASKAALNAYSKSLAIDLKPRGISVAILHPGYVQTRMVGFGGDISPELSAERLAGLIDNLDLNNTGTFWHSNGEELPW
jgi:NAD(P)-dependent dehydrogenase (short-subunit alcohol dehydrogenase family)